MKRYVPVSPMSNFREGSFGLFRNDGISQTPMMDQNNVFLIL